MRVCDALLPRLASAYGVGLASAAEVITVFAVAYGACQVVFGPLGDRYGKLRVITGACLAASMANLACALAPGFPSLLAARALAGAACACIIPLSMAWIGDTTPYESRQGVLARYLLGQIFGMTSGSVAGGFAAEAGWWQWPFVAVAVAFLAVAGLLGRAARKVGEVRLAAIGTTAIALSFAMVAFVPSLVAAGLGCFGTGLGFYMLHNTLQTNATQMAPERRGAAVALFASLFFIGQSVGVALTAQLVERAGTAWGIAASAAAIVPVGLAFALLRERRG